MHEHERVNELVITGACGEHDCNCCVAKNESKEAATPGEWSAAIVFGATGLSAVFTPPLILWLSYQDTVRRNVAWVPDDRILVGMLAAFTAIVYYYWRSKKGKQDAT